MGNEGLLLDSCGELLETILCSTSLTPARPACTPFSNSFEALKRQLQIKTDSSFLHALHFTPFFPTTLPCLHIFCDCELPYIFLSYYFSSRYILCDLNSCPFHALIPPLHLTFCPALPFQNDIAICRD